MPKFSVVITVYNKERFIAKTLQSVLDQTLGDFEVILINDGSTDASQQVIEQFNDPRIRLVNQKNQGASAARNLGISQATGPFIALLDGDDTWKPDYLSEIVQLQDSLPEAKIFATAVEIGSPAGFYPSSYSFENHAGQKHLLLEYFSSSYRSTLLTSSSTVLDREVFEVVGCFDESIKSGQDTDMWIRIGLHYPVAFSTEEKVRYTFVTDSLAKTTRSLDQKVNFEKFREEEKSNPQLQKFIDLNRYALAIKAKTWNDSLGAERFRESVNSNNLNRKQRFLLSRNGNTLRALIKIKDYLDVLGLRLSAFSG